MAQKSKYSARLWFEKPCGKIVSQSFSSELLVLCAHVSLLIFYITSTVICPGCITEYSAIPNSQG